MGMFGRKRSLKQRDQQVKALPEKKWRAYLRNTARRPVALKWYKVESNGEVGEITGPDPRASARLGQHRAH